MEPLENKYKRTKNENTELVSGVAEHSLRGEVEKILFTSEDSAYSVIRIKDAQGVLHCVIGNITGAFPGQSILVSGKWEMHKEHGRQLRASEYTFTLPATPSGIVKYLSSGVIKGIGEKYAQAIVDTFGLETLYILDNASARLREVPGLGKKRIEAIRTAWKSNTEKRNIQIYMQGLGISLTYFNKIYKLYGDKAVDVLKENPYRLASEVTGIGFLLADRIASSTGIAKNDPKRLISGVVYALSQIRIAGHVCLPKENFIQMLCELLSVEMKDAESALEEAVKLGTAAESDSESGETMIYEPGLLHCEKQLPELLKRLCVKRHYAQILSRFAAQEDAPFSEEQFLAVKRVSESPVSIITGGPGVGKTTVIAEIVRRAKIAKLKIVLAAPTGRAAKRMSETTSAAASTIHRLLKWDPTAGQFFHNRANPLPYHLYVIDESSMLDIMLAVALFRAIRPGAAVVIVGDPDQLPSVGPGNVLNDIIHSQCFPVTRLTKIFRQGEGSGIIRAAHRVNAGESPVERSALPQDELTDFYWIEKENPEEAAEVMERLVMERIPKRFGLDPLKDIQILCPMNRGAAGTFMMNERMQELLNPARKGLVFKCGEKTFRLHDKVMQIANNYDKGVFNGDMGFISSINHEQDVFTVHFDSNPVHYSFSDAEQIMLAYAVTVHKSQGSEFPAVVMPLLPQHFMMLQRNLLYTGITRAKKLMVLIGSKKAVSMAVRNAVREPRFSLLFERIQAAFRRKDDTDVG